MVNRYVECADVRLVSTHVSRYRRSADTHRRRNLQEHSHRNQVTIHTDREIAV